MKRQGLTLASALVCVFAACSNDTTKPAQQCNPAVISASRVSGLQASQGNLAPLQGLTVAAADLGTCVPIPGDSGTYLVIPQFATGSGPVNPSGVPFQIGEAAPLARVVSAAAAVSGARMLAGRPGFLQEHLDRTLRGLEHGMAREAPAALASWRASADVVRGAVAPPTVGSTRTFKVLSALNGSAFVTDTAVLRYAGTNILIYVDQNAPPPPQGFTDPQLAAFGTMFDAELYGIDVNAFGAPSDIDNNGHVIVLFTPTVNKLTPSSECQTQGYVSGFFYGLDLIPTNPNSNAGEIFYSLVPDSAGTFSCSHPISQVDRTTPATFIHEFQHMISWNQHVIVRNGPDEVLWLNEGMSHIAEELGSLYFEQKYPPPQARTNPAQLFPDSAEGFIIGDLFNSYSYLLTPEQFSITQFLQGGSTDERGGAWLFLRWLGDQKGNGIYARLEQTALTGTKNVETQSGQTLPRLLGDFSVAVYTDSLPGISRDLIPPQYRFTSRNLRVLFQALYNATSTQRDVVPRPFPIALATLPEGGSASASMVPGTEKFYRLQASKSGANGQLSFTQPGGAPFTDPLLGAQVSVFRCPAATVCK